MARIYKMTDRIPVKVKSLHIEISPLSFDQKATCQSLIMSGNHMKAAVYAIKCSLKSIKGVENEDGSAYELDIENNELSNDCIDELLNLSESPEIQYVAMTLLSGIPKQFIDPTTGKPMEGVEFIKGKKKKK